MNTPYFIIHKKVLDASVVLLRKAIDKYWPNTVVGYSVKSNAMPWVLEYMNRQGFYAEVVSADEYLLAKKCNFMNNHFVYNGIAKNEETFKEAVMNGAFVNIDSQREVFWLENLPFSVRKNIGIRINFDLEGIYPGMTSCGQEGSRFGICYENGELEKLIQRLNKIPNLRVNGIHMHNSIPSRSLDAYCLIAKKACEIASKFELDLKYVDVGGGFFGGLKNRPEFSNYFAVITDVLSEHFDKKETALIVEPGMSILSAAISYATSVVDVKVTEKNRFVVTDGGRTQIDPMFRKTSFYYEISSQGTGSKQTIGRQTVVGFTCIEGDRFFVLENAPEITEGDKIIYHNVGAYTYCSSSNFIKFLPEVYVECDGAVELVSRKWEVSDFINKQIRTARSWKFK